ncbi:MAG: hypothetical protein KBD06_04820 [Candidatus Pacebacteria bacterium]|nr:hypothetical protein [Candidatus Paceibacterota bacterium]
MAEKIIAVVHVDEIPGGLETVRAAIEKQLPGEEFTLVPCRVRNRAPRSTTNEGFNCRRSSRLARTAFKRIPNAHAAIAFSQGKERVHQLGRRWTDCVTSFTAYGKRGLSARSSHSGKGFDTHEIPEMIESAVRLGMLKDKR